MPDLISTPCSDQGIFGMWRESKSSHPSAPQADLLWSSHPLLSNKIMVFRVREKGRVNIRLAGVFVDSDDIILDNHFPAGAIPHIYKSAMWLLIWMIPLHNKLCLIILVVYSFGHK